MKGKQHLQSGNYGIKHPMPDKHGGKVGPAARGATKREGNTDSPPSKSGNSVVNKRGGMRDESVHASGGKKSTAVKYGTRGSY